MAQPSFEREVCTILDPGHVRWIGVIHRKGCCDLLTLEFAPTAGRVEGRISIPAYGIQDVPLSDVSFRSCKVSFRAADPSSSLSFEGRFRDGTITGSARELDEGAGTVADADTYAVDLVQIASDTPGAYQSSVGIYGHCLAESVLVGAYEDHLTYLLEPSGRSEELLPGEPGAFRSPTGAAVSFAVDPDGTRFLTLRQHPGAAPEIRPLLYTPLF